MNAHHQSTSARIRRLITGGADEQKPTERPGSTMMFFLRLAGWF